MSQIPAVPAFDLRQQMRLIRVEIQAAIDAVLDSGEFILGPAVGTLEKQLAEYCGCRHGVAVGTGTDALRLALTALGVGPGCEVITTPFSFIATANTISHCGARPVFVDIDPKTFNIDPAAAAAAITSRTRALLPVHLYGLPADLAALTDLARKHDLAVVEDCAQAIGARFRGQRVGSFGAAGCLSFFPTKNLGACGDGGMVVTRRAGLAERVDVLRRQGSKKKYHAETLGFNSRLDSIQAAILEVKMRHMDRWIEQRRQIARQYHDLLADLPIALPVEPPDCLHVYHQFTIRLPERDQLAAFLQDRGIGTMVYYPIPIHCQALYARHDNVEGSLPESERASCEVLSLPMFPELTPQQQEIVCGGIRAFYGG